MPFQKGQSGNPSGRRRKTPAQILFEDRCREYMSANGFKILKEIIEGGSAQDKKWAFERMEDRGFGKATASVDVETNTVGTGIEPVELATEIANLIGDRKGEVKATDIGSGQAVKP